MMMKATLAEFMQKRIIHVKLTKTLTPRDCTKKEAQKAMRITAGAARPKKHPEATEIAAGGNRGGFLAKARKGVKRTKQTASDSPRQSRVMFTIANNVKTAFSQLDGEEMNGVISCRTYKVKKNCEYDFGPYKHPNFNRSDIVNVGSNGGTSIVC